MARRRRAGVWTVRAVAASIAVGCTAAACTGGPGKPDARVSDAAGAAGGSAQRAPFTLVATGDVIPYPSIIRQAREDADGSGYDFRRVLAGGKPVISAADLAICHMETPYGPPGGPFSGYPIFISPPQVAEALHDAGYDSCSTASNHTLDGGFDGVRRTLDAFDRAGVRHVGSARSAAESARPALMRAGGATVAQLSYTYGTNGIPLPEGRPWAVNLLNVRRIVADARAARRSGADVVLVSLHWGTEWQQAPDEQQKRVADELTRARTGGRPDIDLVIGTHNHVPQPYEKVNGTWVVYGLGDQVASFVPSLYRGNDGSIARFSFVPDGDRWTVRKAEFLAQHSDTGTPFRVRLATREAYPDARRRVREAVLSRGAAADGLTEGTR
jgi:hypothetical protein